MTHQELEDKARQDKDSIETFEGFSVFLGVLLLLSILGNVVLYNQKNMWMDMAMEEIKPNTTTLSDRVLIPPAKSVKQWAEEQQATTDIMNSVEKRIKEAAKAYKESSEGRLEAAIEQAKKERELAKLQLETLELSVKHKELNKY